MTIKSLFLALLIAALGGSLCAQTPNGGYSSPASGGSSSSGASLGTNVFSVSSFGVTAAGQEVCDATFTNTSQTVTTPATDPPFTTAINGWSVFGSNVCVDATAFTNQVPLGTITFVSAHTATVSIAATATNSGGGHLVWAPTEDTQLTAAENAAWNTNTSGGICYPLQLGGGFILVAQPHFNTINCNTQYTGPASTGVHIQGYGRVASRLMLRPDFNFAGCPTYNTLPTCFAAKNGVTKTLWGITGGNQPGSNPAALTCVFNDGIDAFTSNFLLAGFGSALSNLEAYCMTGAGTSTYLLIEDGMGGTGWDARPNGSGGGGNDQCLQCFFGNNAIANLVASLGSSNNKITTHMTGFGPTNATTGMVQIIASGNGMWRSIDDVIVQPSTASNMILCNGGATCSIEGLQNFSTTPSGTSVFAVGSGAGHFIVKDSLPTSGTLSNGIWNLATATAVADDLGGNIFFTTTGHVATLTAGAAIRTIIPTSTYTAAPPTGTTNCASSASPAVCTQHINGSVTIAAAATTIVVNTTMIGTNDQVTVFEDSSLGTKLGVTCNTTTGRTYSVTARTAGTSFTVTASAAPAANPACLNFSITR